MNNETKTHIDPNAEEVLEQAILDQLDESLFSEDSNATVIEVEHVVTNDDILMGRCPASTRCQD